MRQGWDESDRLEWPGEFVMYVQTKQKTAIQFCIYDRERGCYALLCWNERYLEIHDMEV